MDLVLLTSFWDIWIPFLAVAIIGAVIVWIRRWTLVLVFGVLALVTWRIVGRLPDHEFIALAASPANQAWFQLFWYHTYAAIATAAILPTLAAFVCRRRPAP